MATETLIFMPNGDVTLSLTRYILKEDENSSRKLLNVSKPLDQKATHEDGLLESATDVEAELEALAAEDEESVLFFAPDAPEIPDGPTSPPPPRARRGSNASSRRDRSESPPASFWATLKRQAARVAEPERSRTPPPTKKAERIVLSSHEVHCVVSSRHLMLASRYFLTILSGDFPQAITLRSQGHVTIALQDDLDSMIILLNIIHGAGRKVPRQVSLDDLSKLAVLVSKFEMLSTVEFFSDTWIDNLQRGGLPKSYNENVLPLVFVFWVFDRPDEFRDMTRLAQRESTEKLEEDLGEMPILHDIIDAIKRDREFAIETAITVVQALIDRYMAGQAICDSALDDELRYACDSMVLGCLMTSSRKIGIWPKPVAPFNGKKFRDLVKAIRGIRILDVCNKTSSRRWNSHGPSPNCHGLEDSIETSMKSIEAGLDGLKLEDYPKLSEDYSLALQASLPAPPVEEVKEHPKEDKHENLLVYMKEETTTPLREEVKVNRQEFPVPSPHFLPRIDSSKMTEYPRQEVSAPSSHFSLQLDSPKRAESPRPEVVGGSSFFSQRVGFPKAESPKPDVSVTSPRFSPQVEARKPVETVKPEVAAPPSRSPPFQSPQIAISPKQEFPVANYFSPRVEAQKVAESPPIQAPSPRYSPVIISPKAIESSVSVPSPPTLPRTNPFRMSESPKQDFSALSPRFAPQVPGPRPVPSPKIQSPINGFGASLKEEARTRSRERDESAQEGVKVSPSPVARNYSPSKEFQQSRVPIDPRPSNQKVDEDKEEEIKRISTNSPPPASTQNQSQTQKFRMLAKERGSDSEREEVQRAPSVISNLSIDEMLMDIPSPVMQSQNVKEVRGIVGEVKNVQRNNGNGNGNGNEIVKETPNPSTTTTEAEESWVPPKSFKMKKSKKTFSTRY